MRQNGIMVATVVPFFILSFFERYNHSVMHIFYIEFKIYCRLWYKIYNFFL